MALRCSLQKLARSGGKLRADVRDAPTHILTAAVNAPLPAPMRPTFIERTPQPCQIDVSHLVQSYRHGIIRCTDTGSDSIRAASLSLLSSTGGNNMGALSCDGGATSPYMQQRARARELNEWKKRQMDHFLVGDVFQKQMRDRARRLVGDANNRYNGIVRRDRMNSESVPTGSSPDGEAAQAFNDAELYGPNGPQIVMSTYGDGPLEELSARWGRKSFGNVTFGPRNYAYPSSRWLARRFRMKKHKIVKRFRFRRYKLAAVANLPFAKMIRVGLLPELKSSKTKKGDSVEGGLAAQIVDAVQSSGVKQKGKRGRPKSKYQV